MSKTRVTLRTLAAQLGVSIATVSEALSNSPRVAAATKARVSALAGKLKYRRNPLLSEVMSVVRNGRQENLRGTIAALNYSEENAPTMMPYHRDVFAGAQVRAAEMGYKLDLFWIGLRNLSYRRLDQILNARRIQGVMILPFPVELDLSALHWERYSAVSMDYCVLNPVLHTVLPDHHLSLHNALFKLTGRGYERPGLFVLKNRDERVKFRYTSTYLGFTNARSVANALPPLSLSVPNEAEFLSWFLRYRPDAILSHIPLTVSWLEGAGFRVPRDVGFVLLNYIDRQFPCAGLDLRAPALGAATIESIVAQIQRNERGVPATPKTIMIENIWIEGPTVRPAGPTPHLAESVTSVRQR